jgi:hypothetical protein
MIKEKLSQAWRKPLREAMDWLRDQLASEFEKAAAEYLKTVERPKQLHQSNLRQVKGKHR